MSTSRAQSVTKGLTKLDGNLYIDKNSGDIFTVHGNWLKTPLVSIAGTELFDIFEESFGTEDGSKTRKAIARSIMRSFKYE